MSTMLLCSCESTKKYASKPKEVLDRYGREEREIDEKLAAIVLQEYSDLIEQRGLEKELLTYLVNELNPRGLELYPVYVLDFQISLDSESSRTKTTGASARYNKIIKLKYELKEVQNEDVIVAKRTIKGIGSYESNESRFSTYNLEQKAERDVARELAMELKMHLINDLHDYKLSTE